MNALLIALLLSQDAGQAPDGGRPAIVVKAGDAVPWDGVCMDDAKAIDTGKRLASAEAQVLFVSDKTVIATPVAVTAVGAVLAAVASAFGAGYVAGHQSSPPR